MRKNRKNRASVKGLEIELIQKLLELDLLRLDLIEATEKLQVCTVPTLRAWLTETCTMRTKKAIEKKIDELSQTASSKKYLELLNDIKNGDVK